MKYVHEETFIYDTYECVCGTNKVFNSFLQNFKYAQMNA